jgi:hypothetical protein
MERKASINPAGAGNSATFRVTKQFEMRVRKRFAKRSDRGKSQNKIDRSRHHG